MGHVIVLIVELDCKWVYWLILLGLESPGYSVCNLMRVVHRLELEYRFVICIFG